MNEDKKSNLGARFKLKRLCCPVCDHFVGWLRVFAGLSFQFKCQNCNLLCKFSRRDDHTAGFVAFGIFTLLSLATGRLNILTRVQFECLGFFYIAFGWLGGAFFRRVDLYEEGRKT